MSVTVVRDPLFESHDPGPGHPESPARFHAICAALDAAAEDGLVIDGLTARPAVDDELARVHDREYLARLAAVAGQHHRLDADTATSPRSVEAAHLAAGGTIDLAVGVAEGRLRPGIAVVRPPGHHALADRAMGFCLINNVAVAARALIAAGGAERVAIYDWDVHHGNGTQAIFLDDPNVLYMSTHQFPYYPGTGSAREVGVGAAEGATVNVPLAAGANDELLLEVSKEVLLPKIRSFRPDMILISAGFDPFIDDPLGGFEVTEHGFEELSKRWRDAAESVCDGRIAAVLEGGYDLPGLAACVRGLTEAWDT